RIAGSVLVCFGAAASHDRCGRLLIKRKIELKRALHFTATAATRASRLPRVTASPSRDAETRINRVPAADCAR
ncbi:MAG TPA: hypothetical protein VIV54_03755, partial [Burkholderiales bacterium]